MRPSKGSEPAWRQTEGGVIVRVRATPRSSLDAIEGIEPTAEGLAIKARIRAVPEDGAANAAIQRLVAEWLGVPRSAVVLVGGAKSRVKLLRVSGDGAALADRIEAAVAHGQKR